MSLRVSGLAIGYGDVTIVRDMSLTVAPGEAVCLVGPNGAGKTTTLRGIIGLNRPLAGSIRWEGKDLTGRPAHERAHAGIALVPEGRHVFPQLSVLENLDVAARATGGRSGSVPDRITRAMERFPRLESRRSQLAGLLSGGEQQMLAIARALVQEPRLLMIDEMSLGLAPVVYEAVGDAVRQLVREGLAVLLVEQNAALAMDICDRGYLMAGGQILLQGSVEEMKHEDAVQSLYFGAA
ncbi:MAG: ABC transporter ATP-binding protein [Mycobacteriales bacterium]